MAPSLTADPVLALRREPGLELSALCSATSLDLTVNSVTILAFMRRKMSTY